MWSEVATAASPVHATRLYSSNAWDDFLVATENIPFADMNGDGTKDLILGGIYSNQYVLYGSPASYATGAWPAKFDLSTVNGTTGFKVNVQNSSFPAWTNGGSQWPGLSIAAADINHDGKLDLLLSASAATPNSRTNAGAVFVMYQPNTGWPATVNYSTFNWNGTDSFLIEGGDNGDNCGSVVRGVDVTSDAKAEILIGCDYYNSNAGAVYGLYGSDSWSATMDLGTIR
jgi:hypothetical protein